MLPQNPRIRNLTVLSLLTLIPLALLALVAPEVFAAHWPFALTAAPVFNSNPYAGDFIDRAITRAITGNRTIEGGNMYVRNNVRSALNIPRLTVKDVIQPRQPTPTSQGEVQYSYRKLQVHDYMIYVEFNPLEYEGTQFEDLIRGERVFSELAPALQEQIIDEILKQNDHYLDQALWQGDMTNGTAPYNMFDGVITHLANASDTITPSNPVSLTSGNILTKLEETLDLVPEALMEEPTLRCFMSPTTHRLYGKALRDLNYKSIGPEDRLPRIFQDKSLVPIPGFPDDTLLWTRASARRDSNLWMGAARVSDAETVQVEKLMPSSELYFFKMLLKVGTQVGFPDEAVLYKV